jgi:hypothetical protein
MTSSGIDCGWNSGSLAGDTFIGARMENDAVMERDATQRRAHGLHIAD